MSEFVWRDLHVRWHPRGKVAHRVDATNATLGDILTLAGFDPEDAVIENCYFELDESLPRGTMTLSPRS